MHQGKIGGRLGPLRDPATQQMVRGTIRGTFTFTTQGDPNDAMAWLRDALTMATNTVITQKLVLNEVALQALSASLPQFVPEIIAAAAEQAAQVGAQVTELTLHVELDM